MGLFDMVTQIGIPCIKGVPGWSSDMLCFAQIGLSDHILRGRHALAIDENRYNFAPTFWTTAPEKMHEAAQRIEQRWFVGAHANIGGGYRDDILTEITLNWIFAGAQQLGLTFYGDLPPPLTGKEAIIGTPIDSLKTFMLGLYKLFRAKYWRPIGISKDSQQPNVNETIDISVFVRWKKVPAYRPSNLAEWAKRVGLNLDQVKACTRLVTNGFEAEADYGMTMTTTTACVSNVATE